MSSNVTADIIHAIWIFSMRSIMPVSIGTNKISRLVSPSFNNMEIKNEQLVKNITY